MEKNTKIPYNCYVDDEGFITPKSVTIRNTKEVADWVANNDNPRFNRMFNGDKLHDSGLYHEDRPWMEIGISHSTCGMIYAFVSSETDEMHARFSEHNHYVKNFDNDFEAFKKYLTWVSKLGPHFTLYLKNRK